MDGKRAKCEEILQRLSNVMGRVMVRFRFKVKLRVRFRDRVMISVSIRINTISKLRLLTHCAPVLLLLHCLMLKIVTEFFLKKNPGISVTV